MKRNEIRIQNLKSMEVGKREIIYDDSFVVQSTSCRIEENRWEFAHRYRKREYAISFKILEGRIAYSDHPSRSFFKYTKKMRSDLWEKLVKPSKEG